MNMNNTLSKIENKLDKIISDLEQLKDNKLIKIIDELESVKTIIITHDLVRMAGQLKWLDKKENKNDR